MVGSMEHLLEKTAEKELTALLEQHIKNTKIKNIMKERRLCDHCLGRLFARVGYGVDNTTRGRLIREHFDYSSEISEKCWLCSDLFNEVEKFSEMIVEKLNDWEFNNFLIGCRIDIEIVEREESLWSEAAVEQFEPIKSEINREVGKLVEKRVGKEVNFERPEVVATIDTRYDDVEIQVAPLFIYGRYLKKIRGIPQTKWTCKHCLGKGCELCNHTGKMYAESVEELIAKEVMEITMGKGHSFHGMGREDIDAKMLGNGRPFIIEIKTPIKRNIDYTSIQKRINRSAEGKVEVMELRSSDRREVVAIKSVRCQKTYSVLVELGKKVNKEKLNEVVKAFKGKEIAQQTPLRVVHRRADKRRKRRILDIKAELTEMENEAELIITAEAGTYIKEFVHGDEGRTRPSLAEGLGMKCEVKRLDVIKIHEE
jgi:tRNA pseudouridine synthase 10